MMVLRCLLLLKPLLLFVKLLHYLCDELFLVLTERLLACTLAKGGPHWQQGLQGGCNQLGKRLFDCKYDYLERGYFGQK